MAILDTSDLDFCTDPRATAAPFPPVELGAVVVTVDGSPYANAAVPVARRLAEALDVPITFLAVAGPGHRDALEQHTGQLAVEADGIGIVIGGDNVAESILAATEELPPHVLCIASHGRGRSAALVGSVAAEVAAGAPGPLLLVGPHVPPEHSFAGRVIACVDGSKRSEAVLQPAASWAVALGLGMSIVTVAEPVLEPVVPGAPYHRSHGPSVVAEDYVRQLVAEWDGIDLDVDGDAVYDPVSVADGLTRYMEGRLTALVVATTHARRGVARLALGSAATAIVHHAPAPVLLVPPSP
jgi:nucleotide-binding universal stress UspA family protein